MKDCSPTQLLPKNVKKSLAIILIGNFLEFFDISAPQ